MWLYMKLAWRNVLRNKRRTLIAGIAVGIGLASLIFVDALVLGMNDNLVRSATSSFMGEGQIARAGFRRSLDIDLTINGFPAVLDSVRTEPVVRYAAPRILAMATMTSPSDVEAVSLVGIDPSAEPPLSLVDEAIVQGAYLGTGDGDANGVLIGKKLAGLLSIELGDRVVLTAARAGTGELVQDLFRVSGLFETGTDEMDKGMVFIPLSTAGEMLGLTGRAHEIAIRFVDSDMGADAGLPFWKKYSRDGNEAVGWTELMPELAQAIRMSRWSTAIIGVVLFGVVALGIVNTLFMSLYERMFEFGVLRAVGTRPFAVGRLIVLEAGALAAISIVLGAALGLAVTGIFVYRGIDYSGIEYAGVVFRDLLYPRLEPYQFVVFPLCVFLFTVLVGLYPAWYAARIGPAQAMRKSM